MIGNRDNRRNLQALLMAKKKAPSRLGRLILVACLVSLLVFFAVLSAGAAATYSYLTKDLPSPDSIVDAVVEQTTTIYDRNGEILNEIFDPQLGKRTAVPLDQIPKSLIEATIATEDAGFYSHQGINIRGIMRAAYLDIFGDVDLQGGSSITQQLVKNVLIPEKDWMDRSVSLALFTRKAREILLAIEVTRRFPKDQILEMYLNRIGYGNLSYGIEAAAQSYFGKTAKDLDLAESAMLAGLPQAPSLYSPLDSPKRAKNRQSEVLDLMVRNDFITEAQADDARREELHFAPQKFPIKAPHLVMYVRELLQEKYGVDALFRGGLKVYTSIDLKLQESAEKIVRDRVAQLKIYEASNASLVAIRPQTGEIMAMVGSVDYFNPDISGQVNVALAERQPGSSFKPFTYLTAFLKGYTPATVLMDVPSEFPNAPHRPYKPENNDNKFRGPLTIRQALSNSVNVPAIKTLQFAGVQDTIDTAHRMGITSLERSGDYGLSLTLGGGEVKLLDLVYAYSVFANQGVMSGAPVAPAAQRPGFREMDPVAILRVEDPNGKVLEEFRQPQTKQVVSPQQTYLITSILSDNQARTMVFAPGGPLELSRRPAAAKTGTTDDWRDTWTVGYTPDIVAGVWVGNSNNKPMKLPLSVTTAAPIWHDFMEEALKGSAVKQFTRPTGLEDVTVCAGSGLLPTTYCPKTVREVFVKGTAPTKVDDFYRPYWIDRRTGGLAGQDTPPSDRELQVFQVLPPEAQEWAKTNNMPQPPVGALGEYGAGVPPSIYAIPSLTGTLPFSATASPGPNTVPVPTLVNLAVAQAEARLNDAGLKLDRKDVWSSTVPEGIVSQQNPPPGTMATRGSVVTLTVSKGVEEVPVPAVPNVVGLTEKEAKTAIQQAGFKNYPIVNHQGHDVLPDATLVKVCIGCVLSTTPGPGQKVPLGTEILMAVRKD